MKSLRDYSMNLPEEEYHAYPAWSYSIIARYAKEGFGALATLHERTAPTPSMEFGSLFDSVITKGKKTLEEYAVADFSVPESERKVMDYLYESTSVPFDEIPMNVFVTATEKAQYRTNWGPDARYKNVSKYKDYYETIRSGKKLVSKDDWEDAMEMYRAFRSSEYLKNIFGTEDTKDVEYIYQAQFCSDWVIEGEKVKIKIMPDLLKVDHKNKTIQPVDLKTSAMPAYSFADNFIKYRYDIQAELYTDVIRQLCSTIDGYSDYKVLPYLFTDISRSDKVPVTYEYNPDNGFSFTRGDKTYTYAGWKDLLAEILVYEANEAVVPNYIALDQPNNLIDIISR